MYIFQKIKDGQQTKIKILGLTVYEKCWTKTKYGCCYERKYLEGLVKSLNFEDKTFFYFLGIKILKKIKKLTYSEVLKLTNRLDSIYYDMHTLNQVSCLHKDFLPYKRSLEGKEVVLVATGPSAELYKNPIKDAIHVGVNSAIHFDWLKLDYLFVNDGFGNNPGLNDEIDNYRKGECQKFYAIHSPRRLSINRKNGMNIDRIAQTHFYNANAIPYVLEDAGYQRWAVNLECEPLGDIGGTSFSALQFICYTHPKKIYLVGCDAGQSFSKTASVDINYNHQIKMWKMFQDFVTRVYPDIEVVSINPVNLKGMFEDIYTEGILEEI